MVSLSFLTSVDVSVVRLYTTDNAGEKVGKEIITINFPDRDQLVEFVASNRQRFDQPRRPDNAAEKSDAAYRNHRLPRVVKDCLYYTVHAQTLHFVG